MPGAKIATAREGVFISYARKDGEQFAYLLRKRLEAEQIPLWRDREGMVGGRDWWLQITEALAEVEFMALVVTPKALESEIVRKEWRYARQEGVCVFPIKGSSNLDFASLPRWMSSSHFYDLGTIENNLEGPEWQKFVNDLTTRCQTKRVAYMFEDLPEGFVTRPVEFEQLLTVLIDERREEPVAITAALRGAGGFGKTTLAKALCHNERIQDAFDDGILWVTLGENPGDLTGRVEDLIVTLGDERPGFATQDAAVNRLKELLADRDILIVIDDVWDRAHLNPFIQGGPRCARLITTRNFATLPAGAKTVHVDAMQQAEATRLLAAGLNLDENLRLNLAALASRLGEWPLLLRLVNSALRNRIENDKQSSHDAVAWINTALAKRGLTYFDAHNSIARDQAVAKTIGISLDLLSATDRERYGELAIFPEDVEIPLVTLERLWARTGGLDEFDTEELCSRLNRFSLLWNYDANQRRIRLHDVMRKFLIEQQGNQLSSIHEQFLDSHCSIRAGDSTPRWAEMRSDEPYLWDYLAHHLIEAGRGDEFLACVKSWRYLVAKTLVRKSLAVEVDLLAAERIAGDDDDMLRLLRRNFVNSGHLLNACASSEDIKVTLFSRLQHLNELKSLTSDIENHLKLPCVVPASKLPDLPHPALVRTLSGHLDGVIDCAVSANGTTIVSASYDKTLKVWDAQGGTERFTLKCDSEVRACAISGNGATIVSTLVSGMLQVWDAQSGTERFTLRGHTDWVRCCALSWDGSAMVTGSDDETLRVWDGSTGSKLLTLRGHKGWVRCCAISPDGMTIVSAANDGKVKVWDARTGNQRFSLSGHEGIVTGCALSADGKLIISCSDDGTVRGWDAEAREMLFVFNGHMSGVNCCAVSADGKTILSASDNGILKVWDAKKRIERTTLSGHSGRVNSCAVSDEGPALISASDDKTLKIWDVRSSPDTFTLSGKSGPVSGCAISADGRTVIFALYDKTVKVWDVGSATERFTFRGHQDWIRACAVSANGETAVSASDDRSLIVWDALGGEMRLTLHGHANWVNACAMSADGGTIVSASYDNVVKVWNGRTGATRITLHRPSLVTDCALSADGTTMVMGFENGKLEVRDGLNGAKRFSLSGHLRGISSCALSANASTIVSASYDKTLKVWDGLSGAERFTIIAHKAAVSACAVSADGATVVSVSPDQTLRIWDADSGACLSTLHVDGPLKTCACSANGEIIVAGGARGIYVLRLIR